MSSLRPVERALLAIVRAVSTMPGEDEGHHGLLVLDEPTVFLPADDTELLFGMTRRVARAGAGVLFVSHDLDEVRKLTHQVTVLRDGRAIGTRRTSKTTGAELVEMIVGREVEQATHRAIRPIDASGRPPVRVAGARGGMVQDATFSVAEGEIFGVTGLAGAGFEDLPYLLFGSSNAAAGQLWVDDVQLDLTSLTPLRALHSGVGLVPADRQRDGAILTLSVLDNVSMQFLDEVRTGPHLRHRQLGVRARRALRELDVRPANPDLLCGKLSGGNQQKVLMAKWLETRPRLLIVHEPTQGVDVGAREEIYRYLRAAADSGMAILCASSDHEQLASLCDRVAVFRHGRLADELVGDDITKSALSRLCYSNPSNPGDLT